MTFGPTSGPLNRRRLGDYLIWGRWFSAVVAAASLMVSLGYSATPGSHCDVCGVQLSGKFYSATDRFTDEKKFICGDCIALTDTCFICGLPAKTNVVRLADGRILCGRDAETAVLDDERVKQMCREAHNELDRLFSRFTTFPDTNVSIRVVDRLQLQLTFKQAGRDYDCPNALGCLQSHSNSHGMAHVLSILRGLPLSALKATCAHEYSHAWLNENLPAKRKESLGPDANEGFCELVAYLLMDSQKEELQKKAIERNNYTRGQVHCFVEAAQQYGFNDILDWVKYGKDDELSPDDPGRIRRVEPAAAGSIHLVNLPPARPVPAAQPSTLVLKAIFWSSNHPEALINDRAFAPNQEGKVRIGTSNVALRCVAIRQDSVRIMLLGSGQEQELKLSETSK